MKTTRTSGLGGFTLVEIMIVVAIIGLLAAIAIPNFVRTRARAQATTCINNLRQIDSAVQQVAIAKNLHNGDAITYPDDLTPYIKLNSAGSLPPCPAAGTYSVPMVGTNPMCSLGSTVNPAHVMP